MSASEKDKRSGLSAFYAKHPIICHVLMILTSGIVLLWLAMIFLDFWTNHGATVNVPDVKGKTYVEAVTVLEASDLKAEIADSIFDQGLAPGSVVEVWPHAGTSVKPGREVYLTVVSFQPRQVTITAPLTDISSRQAMTYLQSLEIKNIRIVNVPSQYDDLVMSARYNGKELRPGSRLPVTATVVLEVGTVPVELFDESSDSSSVSAEDVDVISAIEEDLGLLPE